VSVSPFETVTGVLVQFMGTDTFVMTVSEVVAALRAALGSSDSYTATDIQRIAVIVWFLSNDPALRLYVQRQSRRLAVEAADRAVNIEASSRTVDVLVDRRAVLKTFDLRTVMPQ